jgi:hypothetical protein
MAVDRIMRHTKHCGYNHVLTRNDEHDGKTNCLGWMLCSESNHDHGMKRLRGMT